jgi:hypothetical protein
VEVETGPPAGVAPELMRRAPAAALWTILGLQEVLSRVQGRGLCPVASR